VCSLLKNITTSDTHVPLIFVMAVLLIALTTDGYFYGLLASLASVVMVNYAFTFPYNKLDYSIYGYPLTFFTMFSVSLVVSTMVTRVKNQEKARIESEKEKIRANLLRAISHDLRTPLTSISGSIGAVLEGDDRLSENSVELLTGARDDAEWLHRMVENLLSVTRIGGDKGGALHTETEVLEEVLAEAAATFRKRAPEVEVTVSVPEEPLFVPMDAMLIEQVLFNLMDNAVTHGKTTTRISIAAKTLPGSVSVSVQDNGRGIDAGAFEHLFDGSLQLQPGKEADSTRGMGIGLSVCKAVIEAHGGTLAAANVPEGGARISFVLPLGEEGNSDDYQG
ncbi:MAG: DUF4118 domain-containing protein, partial [Firmicutes bacterium]|nr:DUF4118 domain-containing protein [Bacillota bacterium]